MNKPVLIGLFIAVTGDDGIKILFETCKALRKDSMANHQSEMFGFDLFGNLDECCTSITDVINNDTISVVAFFGMEDL